MLPLLQDLSRAIQEQRYITISYEKSTNKEVVTRKLSPLGICFSEYYFYLTAYMDREERSKIPKELQDFPTIYRLDRIHSLIVEEEHYQVPSYTSRYQEAEFRKRIQFMYGGRLQQVTFTYVGHDIDAILDRLPTATITWYEEETHTYHIRAEVYGTGIWR
ncbi:WYL domain-containing protein [Veillonella sp. VA142]|uniref:WYL domain-containing protein n=1 Tax=Veillonella sp. VA142 TaxID=741834 RepID=UPI000F8DB906|nr:WYL domain-containing protein [Veillonella sp. VA142]